MAELTLVDAQNGVTEYLNKLQAQGASVSMGDRSAINDSLTKLWNKPSDQWPQGQRPISVAGWVKNIMPLIQGAGAIVPYIEEEASPFYMKPYVYLPVSFGLGVALYFLVLKK